VDDPEPDRIEQLAVASGLAIASQPAAIGAWQLLLSIAHSKWPSVTFHENQLVSFIGERITGDDLPTALGTSFGADLALAAACAAQEPTAHAAFDFVLVEVDAAGAATSSTKDLVEEVKQLLRLQLLVPKDGKPPGITGYRGKGPLRGWVRITATRELIRHKKKLQREAPIEPTLDQLLTSHVDPALAAIKAEYRAEFAVALREAIDDLSVEDRTLLRQQIVDAMSIDAIGAAYGIHRATAARWLNRARAALVSATHTRLAARLKLPVEQVESVIRLVSSQLDASVIRYLRE
jgi:RNA polymerase sigma-70 factor, ECF subfamily